MLSISPPSPIQSSNQKLHFPASLLSLISPPIYTRDVSGHYLRESICSGAICSGVQNHIGHY